jgi:ferredoxin
VALTYPRTVLPPKQAFLPPNEDLLRFQRLPAPAALPVAPRTPLTVFGIHPCDLAAVNQLDWAMQRRHGVTDPSYSARRASATIIGIECLPDEYCFCTCVGTAGTREGADLFLTPVDGEHVVEVLTEKGESLIASVTQWRDVQTQEQSAFEQWQQRKRDQATCHLEAELEELPELLEAGYDSKIWEATAARCYSCGTCTNVCPTCFCFDVRDRLDVAQSAGVRTRRYDSCQFLEFALVAGGHNFRGDREDRVRHRWFRKFVYLSREYGRPFCVGCGRCSQACTADIDLVAVLNSVVTEARQETAR